MLGLLATTLLVAPAGIGEGGREAAPSYTLRAELQTGVNAPLGVVSGSAVFGPREWLSLGAGIGYAEAGLHYGLFVRAHLLRLGAFKIGPAVTASRGRERAEVLGSIDYVVAEWNPGYRLNAGVGIDAKRGRFSARLEGGVGFRLNEPSCYYAVQATSFDGACDAPEIPADLRARLPGRWPAYFTLSLGVDLQPAPALNSATGAPAAPGWYGGPAVWSDVGFVVLGGIGVQNEDARALAVAGVGLYLLGGPVNHAVRGHWTRAAGSFGLRLAGAVWAAVLSAKAVQCIDTSSGCDPLILAVPLGPLAAMLIDDIYLSRER